MIVQNAISPGKYNDFYTQIAKILYRTTIFIVIIEQ